MILSTGINNKFIEKLIPGAECCIKYAEKQTFYSLFPTKHELFGEMWNSNLHLLV